MRLGGSEFSSCRNKRVEDGDSEVTTDVSFENTEEVFVDLEDENDESLTDTDGEVERTEDGEFSITLDEDASESDEINVVVYDDAELEDELASDDTTVVA